MSKISIIFSVILLLFVFLLVSCETEEIYLKENRHQVDNNRVKLLKGDEAKKILYQLNSKLSGLGSPALSNNIRLRTNGQSIDFNSILQVIDTLGIKNYTFKISNHPDDDYKTFHNLVITDKGTTIETTLMKYEMTEQFAAAYNQRLKLFQQFEGKVTATGFPLSPLSPVPCEEIIKEFNPIPVYDPNTVVHNPGGSSPSGGGGSGGSYGGAGTGNGSGSGTGSGGGNSNGATCIEAIARIFCSCGRNYGSLGDYAGSICGDWKTNPGYEVYLGFIYVASNNCRLAADPCNPDGVIGILEPIDDDCNTSKEDLKKIFPNMPNSKAELLASIINNKGKDFGINTKEKLRHFLAQAGHETGGFSTLNVTENMNYLTASLIPINYSKFTMDTIAEPTKKYAGNYTNNPQALANVAMCCDYGNGNEASGDGWKYRGRGIFQLTWKENYQAFKTWYNNKYDPDKDFVGNPNLVSSNDTLAILSGLWYYKTKVLDKIAIDSTTSVASVTKKINGKKLKGLKDRKQRFQKAKDSIDCR